MSFSPPYRQSAQEEDLLSFQRRVLLLEQENLSLREQNSDLLIRLRGLEDLQIKYDMLLGHAENENQRIKLIDNEQLVKQSQDFKNTLEEQRLEFEQKLKSQESAHQSELQSLKRKHGVETQELESESKDLKKKYDALVAKTSEFDMLAFKIKKYEKQVSELEDQLEEQRVHSEQLKQRELSELKSNLTKKLKDKYEGEIEKHDYRIIALQKKLNEVELERDLESQKNKNSQFAEKTGASNVEKLKQVINSRKNIEKQELERLQEAVKKSNVQVRAMIEQRHSLEEQFSMKEQQFKFEKRKLEEKYLELQKEHAKQIFNLTQRMNTVRERETEQLKQQIEEQNERFDKERTLWENMSNDHKQEMEKLREAYLKEEDALKDQKATLKKKMKELKERLSEYEGSKNDGETMKMINSLKDIDDREDSMAKYENGIVFLERQLKKTGIRIEQKNSEITRLIKEVNIVRSEGQQELKELKETFKKERKENIEKILKLQAEVRDLGDKIRLKDKQVQKKTKDSAFEKIELEKQIESLKDMNEELKKDYDRIIQTVKTLEGEYRSERDKGVSTKGDVNFLKRLKWLQLQKQKNQLDIIYREKEEQLKLTFEMDLDKIRHQRDSLKQKLVLLQDDFQRLKKQNEEVQGQLERNKENSKDRKKMAGELHKKLASLNLQVALTENLYKNLKNARSRVQQRDVQNMEIEEDSQREDQSLQ